MALPAGRYGVTKNQLLKIKKLPMNTMKLIEELAEKYDLLGTAAFKNSTSVVTDSSDLVESGAVYDALAEKCDNSVIGTVEDGANPTKSYAIGEHMVRGGKFCTVTSPVTTSSTWVEGSNYTSGDVASVCADRQTGSVGSPNEKITLDANDNKVIRVGSVVNFRVRFTVNEAITNTSFTTLFVMPSFAKPLLPDSIFQINSRSAPYNLTGVGVYIEGSRNVGTKANIPASVYEVHGCYLAE